MGDRVDVSITLKESDWHKHQVMLEEYGAIECEILQPFGPTPITCLEFEECNYAYEGIRKDWAKLFPFYGSHGVGGNYPASQFWADGSGGCEDHVSVDDEICVTINTLGLPHPDELETAQAWMVQYCKVCRTIHGESTPVPK